MALNFFFWEKPCLIHVDLRNSMPMTRVAARTSYFCACAKLITIATRAIDQTVWTVWQLAPLCSACTSAYVSKPVGPFLLHRSVFSIQSCEITLCKYTVLVAILVLQ